MDHLDDVRGRLARDELQITPGTFRKMHDFVRLVHHDRRRAVLLEQTQMQFAEENFAPRLARLSRFRGIVVAFAAPLCGCAASGSRLRQTGSDRTVLPSAQRKRTISSSARGVERRTNKRCFASTGEKSDCAMLLFSEPPMKSRPPGAMRNGKHRRSAPAPPLSDK